ncbi:hypothetical protein GUITHDRAFT_154995 [Guillardia theta CCMP2712]|uniref:DUF4200 domain-containing protein n=1 Tax=Guillardia theta (strain CCMP2712) TaxID=905079 RepID=L1IN79_GUITC|nr:hypothetical protein GUITHDRAFT_154995 [Guillardia theta CCMP2712]EKX37255.1 hypothetical protein GUITHDRAFT_154995 [Guillardia theta CCMP2712]|eukprot:XP_005824235.1 hypothetical protein GUITHDRAFT_154995 [Guillardia theta CCMP2712]
MEDLTAQMAGAVQQMNLEDVSPATRLLEKRRQMFEVQEALETQKEEFARREELFKRREEQLRKQDLELQQSLIRFNKFLQENDSKLTRAEKKATEEIKMREQKEKEIQELSMQMDELSKVKDEMKAILDKNLSDDFNEIGDLLKRYETLKAHHKDLQDRAAKVVSLNDDYRNELQAYMKEGQDTKLKGHNEIAMLQKTLEEYQLDSLVAGSSRERMLEEGAERVLEYGKCLMVINNLYERARSKSKMKQVFTSDTAEQLKMIQEFVRDLSYIVQMVSKSSNPAGSGQGKTN